MSREYSVRVRVTPTAAKAIAIGFILGFPCALVRSTITQTFSLSGTLPEANGQFVQLRTSTQTILGTGSQDVTMLAGQNCRPAPSQTQNATTRQWVTTANLPSTFQPVGDATFRNCADGAASRALKVLGPRMLNGQTFEVNDILAGGISDGTGKFIPKAYIVGDVYANQLCFNDGKCITEWQPEGGMITMQSCDKNGANCAASCPGNPPDYNACRANQALTSTMHIQYSISNTTGTGKGWNLSLALTSVDGGAVNLVYLMGGSKSSPYAPACAGQNPAACNPVAQLPAAGAASLFPTGVPNTAIYHPSSSGDTTTWGKFNAGTATEVRYTCAYAYSGINAILDCFLAFPKAHTYTFEFRAENAAPNM